MSRAALFYQRQKDAAQAQVGDPCVLETKVNGVTFDDCPRVVATLKVGDRMVLCREPYNQKDYNAIRVQTRGGEKAGYVPAPLAARLTPIMASHGVAALPATVLSLTGDPAKGYTRGFTVGFSSLAPLPLENQVVEELDI